MKFINFATLTILYIKSNTGTVIELSAVQAQIIDGNRNNSTSPGGVTGVIQPQIMVSVPNSNGNNTSGNGTSSGSGGSFQISNMPNLEKMIEQINSAVQNDLAALNNSSSQVTQTISIAATPTANATTSSEKKKSDSISLVHWKKGYSKFSYFSVSTLLTVGCIFIFPINCDNNVGNNQDSINSIISALKNQASSLVSQINIMIDSDMNMISTPAPTTTPYFTTEPSVTFLATPVSKVSSNNLPSASPAKSQNLSTPTPTATPTATPTPTDNISTSGASPQSFNASSFPTGSITESQLSVSQTTDPTSTLDSMTDASNSILPTATISTIDLFPINRSSNTSLISIRLSSQPTSINSFGISPDPLANNTNHRDKIQSKSLSIASNSSLSLKFKGINLVIIALGVGSCILSYFI